MEAGKKNVLISGLLKSGSSALVDMLREYNDIAVIPEEFDEYRAPDLIADRLLSGAENEFQSDKLYDLVSNRTKLKHIYYRVFPIFDPGKIFKKGFLERVESTEKLTKRLNLLENLGNKLGNNIAIDEKITLSNRWIKDVANIYGEGKKYVLFDQPLTVVNDIETWKKVFSPFKLILVHRDPKDQIADIIRFKYLRSTYGGPKMSLSGYTLESIYGRSRQSAIKFHTEALKNRYCWVSSLRESLDKDQLLTIDYEGLVKHNKSYRKSIEEFIGGGGIGRGKERYYDQIRAENSIGIYSDILTENEISSLSELEHHYQNIILK